MLSVDWKQTGLLTGGTGIAGGTGRGFRLQRKRQRLLWLVGQHDDPIGLVKTVSAGVHLPQLASDRRGGIGSPACIPILADFHGSRVGVGSFRNRGILGLRHVDHGGRFEVSVSFAFFVLGFRLRVPVGLQSLGVVIGQVQQFRRGGFFCWRLCVSAAQLETAAVLPVWAHDSNLLRNVRC